MKPKGKSGKRYRDIGTVLVIAALMLSACTGDRRRGASEAGTSTGQLNAPSPIRCVAADATSIAGGIDSPLPGAGLAGVGSALIPNGDFSHGLKGWVISDPETVQLDESDRDQGQALRILGGPTTKLRHIDSPRFAVTPGAAYSLTVGARMDSGAAELGAFSMVFFASRVTREMLRFDPPGGAPRYAEYTLSGTVPPGVGQAMLQILYDQHEGSVDLYLYDVRYAETGKVDVLGWAIDQRSAGDPRDAGIDDVSLYLDGPPGAGTLLGTARYGDRRDDVARACGGDRFANSGWHYAWDVSTLAPGAHTLYAVMRSVGGLTSQRSATISRTPTYANDPLGGFDSPVAGSAVAGIVSLAGWAIDRNSPTGTGVDSVRVYLDGAAATGTLLGTAAYGDPYPGVARHFGETRFTNSGWHLSWDTSAVAAGSHTLSVVFSSSTPGRTTALSRVLLVSDGREITRRSPTGASKSVPGATSAMAVDGVNATLWNAGDFSPQWIEVDLRGSVTITRLRLVTAQTPPGLTTHRVYGRVASGDARLLHEFSGYTADGQVLDYSPSTPWNDVRYIRVETVASPSWVAWREIAAYIPGPTPTGTVSGAVVSAGEPVGGAQVELRRGDQVIQSVFTDDRGAYAFAGIPAGIYAVRAYGPSAAFRRWTDAPEQSVDSGSPFELAPIDLPRR
jgi:hypothetical protein